MKIIDKQPNTGSYLFCTLVLEESDFTKPGQLINLSRGKKYERILVPKDKINKFLTITLPLIKGNTHNGETLFSKITYYD